MATQVKSQYTDYQVLRSKGECNLEMGISRIHRETSNLLSDLAQPPNDSPNTTPSVFLHV